MGKKGGYGLVYQSVLRRKDISPEAKAIYAYLCSFADKNGMCFPSVSTMIQDLNMLKDRFYRHMGQLVDVGIVTKERHTGQGSSRGNAYKVHHMAECP